MKLNELTLDIVKKYLQIDFNEDDDLIAMCMDNAKAYIKDYTGLTMEQIEVNETINIAYLALIRDFYDNRGMTLKENNVNKIVDSILGMYRVNLL